MQPARQRDWAYRQQQQPSVNCRIIAKPNTRAMRSFAFVVVALAVALRAACATPSVHVLPVSGSSLANMVEALVGEGISAFQGPHASTTFTRAMNGDMVALLALPKHITADRAVSASLMRNGAALQVQASLHGTNGAHRTTVMVTLPAQAVRVRIASFNGAGDARVVLVPTEGADLSLLEQASDTDSRAATDAEVAEQRAVELKRARSNSEGGGGGGGGVQWFAGAMALSVLGALATLRIRASRHRRKTLASQHVPGDLEEVVLFDSRRNGATVPPRNEKKSDEKVS